MDQNLYNRLYPHQVEGVKFMWNNIHCKGVNGGMLSDDMGLGKTIQGKIHTFSQDLKDELLIKNIFSIRLHLGIGRHGGGRTVYHYRTQFSRC